MTNKEAFDALKRFKRCCGDACPSDSCGECGYNVTDKEWNEAFEKALEALEEQENGCFGSKKCECHEKTADKTIPDSIREAVLNVLDDYADKVHVSEPGAYEQARYAICRILDGCEWKTESFDTIKNICEKAHKQCCDAVHKILEGQDDNQRIKSHVGRC